MFVVSFRSFFLCLFLQLVTGKSLDLQYGYDEIEDPFSQINQEEIKKLESDQISDDAIQEICKNFKKTMHIKQPESVINCLETIFDMNRRVILVKRDAAEMEGSGDTDVPVSATSPDGGNEVQTDAIEVESENVSEPNLVPPESKVQVPPEESKTIEETSVIPEKPETPTENPGSFQGGFDKILKNTREQNETSEYIGNSDIILKTSASNGPINLKSDSDPNGEEARTGESKEQPTAASPNNMLLIVIAALGVIGAVAFVYNFVKTRRENKEIDEVVRLETEGKELKEIKPLIKSPLAQNGAKSMEYIDADPQIQVQTETRVEVNRDNNSD